MLSVMNPMGWSLAAKLPKGGIFPLLIFLARSVASLNSIVVFIHLWMLCSSSWVVFKTSYTISVGWVGEQRGIIREEHMSVGPAEFLWRCWDSGDGWRWAAAASSHGSTEGLSCSEVHVCLLSLSLGKSYVGLAGLHQVNRPCWTDLVRNASDVFVLKKPIGRVLTKPLCHGQSWPERTSEPEANRAGSWRDWLQSMVSGASNTTSCWEPTTASASFLDKARGEIFWPSRVTLLPAVGLCVARREVMPPWADDVWDGPAPMALPEGVWEPSVAVNLELSSVRHILRTSVSPGISLKDNWEGDGVEIVFRKELLFFQLFFFFLLVKAFYKQLIKFCIILWQL